MKYNIIATPKFIKDLKRLAKKYSSLKVEYEQLLEQLIESPTLGVHIGNDCYKIRLSIASKGKGKSGGARIITCVKVIKTTVFIIGIYDKSEVANYSNATIKARIKEISS